MGTTMLRLISFSSLLVSLVVAQPIDLQTLETLLKTADPSLNSVDITVPEDIIKKTSVVGEFTDKEISLGSQFAVAQLAHAQQRRFPERIGLITGHRIPLGLFPKQTQNRILEVQESSTQDPKYVNASSFRRSSSSSTPSTPSTSTTSKPEITTYRGNLRSFHQEIHVLNQERERDSTYEETRDSFVPFF